MAITDNKILLSEEDIHSLYEIRNENQTLYNMYFVNMIEQNAFVLPQFLLSVNDNEYSIDLRKIKQGVEHSVNTNNKDIALTIQTLALIINAIMSHPKTIYRKTKTPRNTIENKDRENLYHKLNGATSIRIIKGDYEKGKGVKHSHEYNVRGHYRHYRNGKTVFIKPYVCCKGKSKIIHEYSIEEVL